jgi:hypothetical protein
MLDSISGRCGIGYRRILEVEPKHADALHRRGQLLATRVTSPRPSGWSGS